ncbi:MAG: hypothetical protein QOC85_1903, partial [Streptomyces sp.]|nr:hypothetical protein [Streptomyces sp.]
MPEGRDPEVEGEGTCRTVDAGLDQLTRFAVHFTGPQIPDPAMEQGDETPEADTPAAPVRHDDARRLSGLQQGSGGPGIHLDTAAAEPHPATGQPRFTAVGQDQ